MSFFKPNITKLGAGLALGRIGGELAVEAMTKARLNRPKPNPYAGQIDQGILRDSELYKSELGTSVYADVTFDSVNYTDISGREVTTPKMKFAAILVSVAFPRRTVKTEIQGRNGTVKEYIGEDDAQVSFRGVITGSNGSYPQVEVSRLKDLIKAPVAIPVICAFLQNLDIDTVVFEDRQLEQEEGGYSYQTFSLNAISDTPQELLISGY